MSMRPLRAAVCCILLVAGCTDDVRITLSGRVFDARSGAPVDDAELQVHAGPASLAAHAPASRAARTRRTQDGWYVLPDLLAGDTVRVGADGYLAVHVVVAPPASRTDAMRRRHDVWLDPVIDTAWTADGPVDASTLLERAQAARKKLSPNEVRLAARRLLPDARIRTMALVEVGGGEEWMIEVTIGHAEATIYLDARLGVLRSVESDDRLLDRRLQQLLRGD